MAQIELIQQAMMQNPPKIIGFTYTKVSGDRNTEMYTVEPYEIDGGQGIFWGYKLNDPKPGIRKFYLSQMFNEQILDQVFSPRWTLYPYGK